MSERSPASLDAQLQAVSRQIPPPRDLWPAIAAQVRLEEPAPLERGRRAARRAWRRTALSALAASLAAASVVGALTWAIVHSRLDETVAARATAQTAQFGDLNNPQYIAARDALEHEFRERLMRLDPQTRAKIETSLAVIRKAHAEIGTALTSDPTSSVLEQLWQSTWHQELDLYDCVVQGTEPTFARI